MIADTRRAGLCGDCLFARIVESARGSTFWRCARSETEPRFPKYPPLPVRECAGYVVDPVTHR